jgi:hypothetical protein
MSGVVQQVRQAGAKAEPQPLTIGPAHDRFEAEADRIAARLAAPQPVTAPAPSISPVTGVAAARKRDAPEDADDDPLGALVQKRPAPAGPPPEEPEPEPDLRLLGQRAPTGGAPATAAAPVAHAVQRMRAGGGQALAPATRQHMEQGLGHDLSAVRVHASPQAATAARALNARAFTVGRDVFFGQGTYRPETSAGRHLLAHELVHTVQQSGGSAQAQRVQRTPTAAAASATAPPAATGGPPPGVFASGTMRLDIPGKRIEVPELELPPAPTVLKGVRGGAISPAGTTRVVGLPGGGGSVTVTGATPRAGDQVGTWRSYQQAAMSSLSIASFLPAPQAGAESAETGPYITQKGSENFYFLMAKHVDDAQKVVMGTASELKTADRILQPDWSKSGRAVSLDVDHIIELQIGGADAGENMWLLESGFNRSVGSSISQRVRSQVRSVLQAANRDAAFKAAAASAAPRPIPVPGSSQSDVTSVRNDYTIVFRQIVPLTGGRSLDEDKYWTKSELRSGAHLGPDQIRFLTLRELQRYGFAFNAEGTTPTTFRVFANPGGGKVITFRLRRGAVLPPERFFIGVNLVGNPTWDDAGLHMTLNRHRRRRNDPFVTEAERTVDTTVAPQPHLGNAGVMTPGDLTGLFGVPFRYMSPTTFGEVGITPDGVVRARGEIAVAKLFLPNARIPIFVEGTDVGIAFPIPEDSLSLGPVTISEPTLEIGMGEEGFFISGGARVAVDSLGSGTITARGTNEDVTLAGDFTLAMDFLDDANVSLSYSVARNELTGTADASVETDRLPGITGGSVHVEFSNDSIGVQGTISLASPLEGGSLTIGYLPETGLTIGARDIPLPADRLPGISSASVSLSATRAPDTGVWRIAGSGSAEIETPGVTGSIDVSYDNGALLISGTGEVAIGQATGTLSLTVTNMPLDEDGNPVEGEIADSFSIWGRGSVTITFGEILTGTVGIEYTPDARVILSGEIALPESFEVFERREWSKELLSLETPDFPIWGVSIAGIGFGIFASADGYVNLEAWLGPGTIEDARISAEMDLERPEDLSVTGSARFVVPAYGGLNLGLGGNIYARAAVAYARGRVGITGDLGLEIGGGIGIDVNWTRQEGLSLDASASVEARPKFRLGLEASISAGVDLGVKTVSRELGQWDTTLGEFGPDMTLGVTMPARWSEARGLEMSLDDIEVQRPSINARDLLDSAFDSVVD